MNSYLTSLFDQYFNPGQMTFLQSCSFDGIATLLAKKIHLTLFFSLLFLVNLFAQPIVDLCLTPTTDGPYVAGQEVVLEVVVMGFEDITGLQLDFQIDPTQMTYVSGEGEIVSPISFNQASSSTITALWFDPSPTFDGQSVSEGSSIATLTFNLLINTQDLNNEIIESASINNINGPVDLSFCGIPVEEPPSFNDTLDLCLMPTMEPPYVAGQIVAFETVVTDFEGVSGFQFGLRYSSSQMDFLSSSDGPLPFVFVNNPNPGDIRVSWTDAGGSSVSLPNGSNLISFDFEVLENSDELNVDLTDEPFPVEILTTGNQLFAVTNCGEFLSGPPPLPVEVCFMQTAIEVLAGEQHGPVLEVTDFTNVTEFKFQFAYNAVENNFLSIAPHPNLSTATTTMVYPGLIEVSWSGEVTSLNEGDLLMEVVFEATENFADRSFELLSLEGSSSILHNEEESGQFIFCGNTPNQPSVDICPSVPSGQFTAGETIDVPLIVQGYSEVGIVNVPINYPEGILQYESWLPADLSPEYNASITDTPVGGLSFSANISGDDSPSIIDGDTLVIIRFLVLTDVENLNIFIDPAIDNFYAAEVDLQSGYYPISACSIPILNGQPTNVSAKIQIDENGNCFGVPIGPGLIGWTTLFRNTVTGVSYSGITGNNGVAYLNLPSGNYLQNWTPPNNPFIWDTCDELLVNVPSQTASLEINNVAGVSTSCPDLEVHISSFNLRPCVGNNTFIINYNSTGSDFAVDAYVDISIDPAFEILSTSQPFSTLSLGTYRFQLGDLPPNTLGSITITGHIDCDFTVDATLCASATIYPRPLDCTPPDPNFQGANLQVTPQCDNDSIRFQIKNIGDGPSGEIEFHVIEDVIIYNNGTIDIDAGEMMEMAFAAEGTTFRLELDRPEAAPYLSHPLGIEEGCGMLDGGGISTGFVNDFSLLDDDSWFDRYCQEVTAAYDPNDKQAIPAGVGEDNDIFPNQTMDYKIRFQNTGTDTAFNVTLRDQIDTSVLDLSTFVAGASSHPYRVMNLDNELVFTFENILLPDSTTNPIASNGYVHFQIAQQPDLVDGTVIENDAAIYFDFNEPIITNVSRQTIDRNMLTSTTLDFIAGNKPIPVYPTPTQREITIDLSGEWDQTQFIITDMLGRTILQKTLNERQMIQVDLRNLLAGHYAYQLIQSGRLLQSGRIIRQ